VTRTRATGAKASHILAFLQKLQLQRIVPADKSSSHSKRTSPQWQLPR
jgi:hypothetical protein